MPINCKHLAPYKMSRQGRALQCTPRTCFAYHHANITWNWLKLNVTIILDDWPIEYHSWHLPFLHCYFCKSNETWFWLSAKQLTHKWHLCTLPPGPSDQNLNPWHSVSIYLTMVYISCTIHCSNMFILSHSHRRQQLTPVSEQNLNPWHSVSAHS